MHLTLTDTVGNFGIGFYIALRFNACINGGRKYKNVITRLRILGFLPFYIYFRHCSESYYLVSVLGPVLIFVHTVKNPQNA